jgi:two-component system cell cycle sensor histidine kinase/response regulator CckA
MNNERFDLVITDYTLPNDITGIETYKIMKDIDPNIKGILMTGYSKENYFEELKGIKFDAILLKPFRLEQISVLIHDIFNIMS